jgi:hypothetical protein
LVLTKFEHKVIAYQFHKIGIEIAEDEIEMFIKFCYAAFDFTPHDFALLEQFLIKTKEANDKSNYLDQTSFTQIIGEKWFHLCYNYAKKIGKDASHKYKQSPISTYFNPGKWLEAKFYIRSRTKF